MSPENQVAVVGDSANSMRPEYPIVQELGVHLLPVQVVFGEGKESIVYSDFDLTPDEFYRKMREMHEFKKFPTTSGAITNPAIEIYERLANETNSIISIHITSKKSTAYNSALIAARQVIEQKPELTIEVIDSRSVSLGTWFLVEQAARLAQQGASLEEIKEEVLANVPKIKLYAAISTLENVKRGGRVDGLMLIAASLIGIRPILEVIDGDIKMAEKTRSVAKARQAIINRVRDEEKEIIKMGIVHTNDPKGAEQVRDELVKFYHNEIPTYEAGLALSAQAGENVVAIAYQTK